MSTPVPDTGFPQFADGDVTIIVSTRHHFKLHSRVLRSAAWFADQFDTITAPKLSAQARRNGATPYRFILMDVQQTSDDEDDENEVKQELIAVQVSDNGASVAVTPRASLNDLSGEDPDKCWVWLFGSFYGIEPRIDDNTFGTTLTDCVAYLDVADQVRADFHKNVELILMRQDVTLWKAIANTPTIWAELGQRIQSPPIFKEAIIHLVGKWKMFEPQERARLAEDIAKLCQYKWDELELAKRAIEIRMCGHYPPVLCRYYADKPHRTGYANDILMWMGLAFFRQYLAQAGLDRKNRLAADGGYKWYKQIQDGGSAYIDHDDMRVFHSYFPMSSKLTGVMEQHMNVIKEEAKVFVKDILISRTHIHPASMDVETPWLTCVVVEDGDLPWKKGPQWEEIEGTEVVIHYNLDF